MGPSASHCWGDAARLRPQRRLCVRKLASAQGPSGLTGLVHKICPPVLLSHGQARGLVHHKHGIPGELLGTHRKQRFQSQVRICTGCGEVGLAEWGGFKVSQIAGLPHTTALRGEEDLRDSDLEAPAAAWAFGNLAKRAGGIEQGTSSKRPTDSETVLLVLGTEFGTSTLHTPIPASTRSYRDSYTEAFFGRSMIIRSHGSTGAFSHRRKPGEDG